MKIQFVLLFFFQMIAVSLSAQRLTVDKFVAANDISATVKPRQDGNGQLCALLRIEVVDAITSVEGGVVGNVVDRGSEKWVYLIGGQREFRLVLAHHLPVQVSTRDYPSIGENGVKSGTTYLLTLVDPSSSETMLDDEGKQFLVMTVSPKNATVLINGNLENVDADGVVTSFLSYGTYRYQVMAKGYKPENGTVTIGRQKAKLNVSLVSTMATLDVTCSTTGAEIYINGTREGTNTWRGPLAAGSYSLEARLAGHQSRSLSVTLTENENRSVTIPALQPMYGAMKVNFSPANAEVWVDGKMLGTSPDIFRNVSAGSHSLQIKKIGYETKSMNIMVNEGRTADVTGSLTHATSQTATTVSVQTSSVMDRTVKVYTVNGVSFEMIRVEGGSFMMGANEGDYDANSWEKPRHRVTLSGFYIGKTEVTQSLWKAVMGSSPSSFKGKDLPVENVSYNECQTFVKRLNSLTGETFCLPTEAEWEYAARGGSNNRQYKYSGHYNIDAVAWYNGNSGGKTHAVGKKQPNDLGLYDMTGNVQEWCADGYDAYSSLAESNPKGVSSSSDRVIRGGCWRSDAGNCRVSSRSHNSPDLRYNFIGLRLSIRKTR